MKIKKIIIFGTISILLFLGVLYSGYFSNDGLPKGWFPAGKSPVSYNMGVDTKIVHGGKTSGFIKSKSNKPEGFGTLMQMCQAKDYLGKRVRMTSYIKAEDINNWAGMWMRVDGAANKSLSFDNMRQRPIKGSKEWQKYEIVLDVPENSINLAFGIILDGTGQAWIDDIKFEIVSFDIPTTDLKGKNKYPEKPLHLDFE